MAYRRMKCGQRWLCGLLLSGILGACETNHAALEKKPTSAGEPGGGGSNGVAGSPAQIAGGSPGQGGGHPDDEPPGSNVFTFLNGVVDAPSVVLCLAKVGADGGAVPFGDPLTDKPFEYGDNLVLKRVAGADLATDTLQPFIIAGELALIKGLGCEDAVARAQDEEAIAIDVNAHAAEGAEAGATNDAGASSVNGAGRRRAAARAGKRRQAAQAARSRWRYPRACGYANCPQFLPER